MKAPAKTRSRKSVRHARAPFFGKDGNDAFFTRSPARPFFQTAPLQRQKAGAVSPKAVLRRRRDPAAPETTKTVQRQGDEKQNAPSEVYVIPFDSKPVSAPGEQIILGAVYSDPKPDDYQLVYTSKGGHFDTQGSKVTTKTIAGLKIRNLDWFIDKGWKGSSTVSIKLEVQKKSDGSVVKTKNWTFSKKTFYATTLTQKEGEGEVANPATYTYTVGPSKGKDAYKGHTILELFPANTSNLDVSDVKKDYAKNHNLTTKQKVHDHFIGGSGHHGTFTVFAGDKFFDRHAGWGTSNGTYAKLKAALKSMKEIYEDQPQTYESEPGKTLGKYMVRRIMKTDGTLKIKKWKVK